MNRPILELKSVTKVFPVGSTGWFGKRASVKAVDGVSLSLLPRQTLAIVGESGCGKTTTARLILKLIEASSGTILFHGEDVASLRRRALREYRKKVQAVFQDPWASLNPRMRVREVISEPLIVNERCSRKEVKRRVDEALIAVGLSETHAEYFPHEFSGGQRQRIAIASALIARPELIVLDEPVSALDVSIRSQIMNLFKDLQEEYGITYVIVAHDLGTTRYMADLIAVMYLGRIVEFAPSEDFFDNPKHPYSETLLSVALPVVPNDEKIEVDVSGEVPSPINPPSGCAFHPRCGKKIGRICEDRVPTVVSSSGDSHEVACHLFDV